MEIIKSSDIIHKSLSNSFSRKRKVMIDDLPMSVLVEIFTHFKEEDLYTNIAPVCKKWNLALSHPSLWKQVEFVNKNATFELICQVLRSAPNLESIRLVSVPNIVSIIRHMCRCNRNLQVVSIKHCLNIDGEPISEAVLLNLIKSCQKLRALNLKGTPFTARRFYKELALVRGLECLNVSLNNGLMQVGDLMTIVLNCQGLKELTLTDLCKDLLTDLDMVLLLGHLKATLTNLKLDANGLGPDTFHAVLRCRRLEGLSFNNATDMSADILSLIPKRLHKLRQLKISNGVLLETDDICKMFANGRANSLSQLESLNINGCWRLGDDALKAIVNTCAQRLTYLSLQSCKSFTENGVQYAIEHCHRLIYLNLAYILSPRSNCYSTIPTHLSDLSVFVISKDNITNITLAYIKQALPQINILIRINEFYKHQYQYR